MALLSLSNISKYYGENLILENISFSVETSHKIGLVGANGSGKTTLFKIISNEISPDSGEIYLSKNTKVSYVDQFIVSNTNQTVLESALEIHQELQDMEKELETLASQLAVCPDPSFIQKQHELTELFKQKNGYTYQSVTRATLIGLGFDENELSTPVQNLSGGQKTKLALAKLLLSDANLLLLDEPTNNLDISSLEWLENYLINYHGSFIVISHDRYFLDKVTNETIALENHQIQTYPGNYSKYLQIKRENEYALSKKYSLQKKEINRLEKMIEQQIVFGKEKNYKIIKNKEKSVERLTNEMVPPSKEPETMHFHFDVISGGNQDVILASHLFKSFESHSILEDASFQIHKKERVFLIGPNGCGKTTLLNMIMNQKEIDCGTIVIGSNMKIAYYQQTSNALYSNKTILDYIWNLAPKFSETEIRSALARFLFKGEDVFKLVSELSGGEKARISLLEIMLTKSNMLILDEPTNHLDIPAREALEDALADYEGTLLIVSHDRYFINKLASKILYFDNKKILELHGNYHTYLEYLSQAEKTTIIKNDTPNKIAYLEKKEREAQERKNRNRITKIEAEIEKLSAEHEQLKTLSESPENMADYEKLMEITNQMNELNERISQLYAEWERLI